MGLQEDEVGLKRRAGVDEPDLEVVGGVADGADIDQGIGSGGGDPKVLEADVACPEADPVGAGHEVEDAVVPGVAAEDEHVVAGPAEQRVGALAAVQAAVAQPADEDVLVQTARQAIVADADVDVAGLVLAALVELVVAIRPQLDDVELVAALPPLTRSRMSKVTPGVVPTKVRPSSS